MKAINTKYKVTAEVLTPLSIGQGTEKDWVYGVDFLTRTDEDEQLWLCHLDMNKMVAAGVDIPRLTQCFANGDVAGVKLLIGNKLLKVSDFQLRLPCSVDRNSNPIKTFLRNSLTNHPVLAGSSLKGALRSVLFADLRGKDDTENDKVFGSMKDGNDFMRFVRVGDFEFEKTCLVNTKIFNLQSKGHGWEGGWKHKWDHTDSKFEPMGFNTIYECLPPKATAEGSIMFADTLFDRIMEQPHRDGKNRIMHSPISELCDMVNNHTLDYLDREIAFFSKYSSMEKYEEIDAAITSVYNECVELTEKKANSCVLKMSVGSGFHSITGDWQFDDYTGANGHTLGRGKKYEGELPKSRKLAVSGSRPFSLMGFVKLTFTKE